MMMTKPAPEKAAPQKKDAVADLERRLAQLSGTDAAAEAPPPAFATAPVTSAAAAVEPAPSSGGVGGKNALLARIMAAQERAKQAQSKPPAVEAPPPADLLDLGAPPAAEAPPAFDFLAAPPAPAAMAPPMAPPTAAAAPPPSFDLLDVVPPPAAAASAPQWNVSAPSMDDVMEHDHNNLASMQPVAPPEQQQEESLESIIGAIEGLSEEEKRALLAEQTKIMESIEQNKTSEASRKADAFESRSFSAALQSVGSGSSNTKSSQVRVVGSERTQQAIADGTAVVVQCLACQNLMQVTNAAALMFCPVCQVVSPVEHLEGDAAAAAIAAASGAAENTVDSDLELAKQLQKEEYKMAERQERAAAQKKARDKKAQEGSQSWGEWLGITASKDSSTGPERPHSFAQPPTARGEVGLSLPPGSSGGGLTSATTGAERTYATNHAQEDRIMGGGGSGGARMAESKPLFNCVADSMMNAASTLSTAIYNPEDEEGNVHGVDNSSLLAVVPQVSRDTQYKSMD